MLTLMAVLVQYAQAQTNHSSYRVAIENLVKQECGIHIDLVQTEMFMVQDGKVFNEETTVKCPTGGKLVVSFNPPITDEAGTPLNPADIRYEIQFIGGVVQRMRACNDVTDLCSVWVNP